MGGQHSGHGHQHQTSDQLSTSFGDHDGIVLKVDGMTCSGCANKVSKAILGVSTALDAHVDLGAKEARIHGLASSNTKIRDIVSAIESAGYRTTILSENKTSSFFSLWSTMVLTSAVLTAIMITGDWFLHWQHHPLGRWTLFAFSTIVQLYTGSVFLKGAIRQALQKKSDMDTLVALGSWTAYIYSCWALFSGNNHHLYFAESGSIISLVSLGHFLEHKMSERAQDSLKKLMNLSGNTVSIKKSDGTTSVLHVRQLKVGDILVLKSGDRVPVDAVVTSHEASFDESAINGEPYPIDKKLGDTITSGTLVLDGYVEAKVTAIGKDTALSKIIESVKRAQISRASIQRLADKVSSIFVPIVILLALSAFGVWYVSPSSMSTLASLVEPFLWPRHIDPDFLSQAILCAVGVLIIACPCAMGLATPAALMAGSNRAAANGVLIRDASAIEKSSSITHVFFDKTGTLTAGELSVEDFLCFGPKEESLSLAKALTEKSKHPISLSILNYTKSFTPTDTELTKFTEERGKGLSAQTLRGETVRLGSLSWHTSMTNIEPQLLKKLQESPHSINVLSKNNHVLAVFTLKDKIKPETHQIIAKLQKSGIQIGIISGDRLPVVRELATELGIAHSVIHAETPPEKKASLITSYRDKGYSVAFVGDGINDAPALKAATLGIAVYSASDIAKESADLILMKNDIRQIAWALEISAKTLKTIKQNLFWAFCYNVLAIPLAFMGFVSPIICAAAMGLSDLFVVLNSLRLARSKGPLEALHKGTL